MRALIVGSSHARGALAAARALARADWIVGVGTPERGLTSASRATHRRFPVPPPEEDPKAFLEAVNQAVVEGGYEVVFGAGDAEVLALSKWRRTVRAIVPYPSHETLEIALDKLELMNAAESAGLTIPRTDEASPAGLAAASYPAIVKARMHWSPERAGAPGRLEASVVADASVAAAKSSEIRANGGDPLIQERLRGALLALTVVVDEDSKAVVRVQQRAEHVWPPESGVSVRAMTEPVDESLAEKVGDLLTQLQWAGLAQLQFIAPPGGTPRLIDLNARFYGSLALAVAAGPNLPAVWGMLATGRPVEIDGARSGVRYQWLDGDIRRALRERRGGLGRDLWSTLRFSRGAAHSIWSVKDPAPAFRHVGSLSSRALRKMFR